MTDPKIIIALDYATPSEALQLVERLVPTRCRLKVGLELYTAAGTDLVRALTARGFDVFLDLKLHDIPNTVAQACRAAMALDVWMLTVHCHGGPAMLRAAHAALAGADRRPLLAGVTVLTSMDQAQLAAVGVGDGVEAQVLRLARLAAECRLDGVVAAPTEAASLRAALPASIRIVTPGIRLAGDSADDQSRFLTPGAAVAAGADYLVVGRPVTRSADPLAALAEIECQLETR